MSAPPSIPKMSTPHSIPKINLGPLTGRVPSIRIEFSGGAQSSSRPSVERPPKNRQQLLREAEATKPQIMKIVGIDSDEGWKVIDSIPEKNLYLIHPDEEYMEELSNLIGVIVDLANRKVLVQSTGFTPTAISDTFEPNAGGDVMVTDIFGNDYLIPTGTCMVRPKFEGKIIRIFKHDGTVYLSSSRKISVERSKVAGNRTLLEIYESIGGPTDYELFEGTKKSSPFVHVFVLSTPETRLVNKLPFTKDLLVYKRTYRSYDSSDPTSESVPKDLTPMGSIRWEHVNSLIGGPARFLLEHFVPVDSVSSFLQIGFMGTWYKMVPEGPLYDDPRAGLGEAIIVEYSDTKSDTRTQIEIRSSAYNWRFGMRDENPAVENQFYILTSNIHIDTNTSEGRAKFMELMPIYPQYDVEQMMEKAEQETIAYWPSAPNHPPDDEQIGYRQGRLYNVWVSYMMAVSYDVQSKVAPLYNKYLQKREELTEWLQKIAMEHTDLDADIGPRAINIITSARRNAHDYPVKGQSVQQRVNLTIRRFIKQERGDTMYRMLKIMDRMKFLESRE